MKNKIVFLILISLPFMAKSQDVIMATTNDIKEFDQLLEKNSDLQKKGDVKNNPIDRKANPRDQFNAASHGAAPIPPAVNRPSGGPPLPPTSGPSGSGETRPPDLHGQPPPPPAGQHGH
ncbi:MAG: hypothetical protein H7256_14725 [Bdellovibrio sp.]|nr:hypothetical protein [Bdellovibrio sp.]